MTRAILITGASRGIGRATALHLARTEAAHLFLVGREAPALGATAAQVQAEGGTATPLVADVTQRATFVSALAQISHLDALVAAAGISGVTPVDQDSDELFDAILAADLTGVWNTVRAALPKMGPGGRMVLVSSVLGRFGVPGYGAYCAAKHGLIGLTKALALELIPRGIFVNAVAPGWVDTDMAATGIRGLAQALNVDEAEARRRAEHAVPVQRFFQPEEIAHGIAWMLNPANTTQVGQCLNLDGGVVHS